MRSIGLSCLSLVLTSVVISNAYYQKKQFYPSVVYITKSNPSMAVIYIQFFVIVLMLGKLLRKVFLGTLRAAEFEHLMERFWYALTETCLAFTVFRDDFNPRFVALFTVLLFLKSFHWLAEERVDYMERSPMISWLFHIRVTSLLSVLGFLDYLMIVHAYNSTITKGPTVQLVFGFEYAILITMVANTVIKYVLHAAEMRAETPWENKAVFLLYTELIIGLIKVILYALFVVIMAKIYALPMFVFRPMFYTMRNFKKALNDVIMSRRAIRNMNTLYPDATPDELSHSDNICIICREDMVANSKKLPCGHIFHTACLRSWFQRQQTCPTCRLNILRTHQPNNSTQMPPRPDAAAAGGTGGGVAAGAGAATQQQPQQQGLQAQIPLYNPLNNPNENPFANIFSGQFPPITSVNPSNLNAAQNPFLLPPPPFPFMPFAMPPPPMPSNLETLTDEELRALEGNERKHIEERIKLLRNIQLLLDASVALMNQYSAITANLPPIPVSTVLPNSESNKAHMSSKTNTGSEIPSTSSGEKPSQSKEAEKNTEEQIPSTSASVIANNSALETIESVSAEDNNQVRIEDIGSEEHVDLVNNKPNATILKDSPFNDLEENSSDVNEIRKRRLQKFLNEERSDITN